MARGEAVLQPNLGLYLGRSPLTVPTTAVQDGMNFRIKDGRISNRNIGFASHGNINLGLPTLLIDEFPIRGIAQRQIFGTRRDLFTMQGDTLVYINARYNTGTVDVSSADPAVVSVDSGSPEWQTNGIKAGDFIAFGADDENDPEADWYEIDSVDAESQLTLTGAVTGAPLAAQSYTIRRTFTGSNSDPWDTEIFVAPDDGTGDDLWFATNGVDYVVTWDGQADQIVIRDDMGLKCRRISTYKNMMIYAHLVDEGTAVFQPTSFINSDIGRPLNAGNTGTGLSEQFRIHDSPDHIKDIQKLGDFLVFYCERHVILATFVGDPLVFAFREAANGVGPIASRLVADFGDYHEFIGHDSQYLFDGVQVTEIGKHVWRDVLRQRDATRHEMGFHHFDEENGELLWLVPLTTDSGANEPDMPAETAFTEHYLEEVGDRNPTPFSRRYAPFFCGGYGITQGTTTWDELDDVTWEEFGQRWNDGVLFAAFPLNLMGCSNGCVNVLNASQSFGGTLRPSFVRFGRRVLGDRRMRGLLTRVYPFASDLQSTLFVRTRYFDHPSANAPARTQEDTFDHSLADEEKRFVTPYRRGLFFEVEFGTDGAAWELDGYDVDVRPGGER